MTSTLIFGEYDAVLVDAMTTVAEAEALADWIALHNRNHNTFTLEGQELRIFEQGHTDSADTTSRYAPSIGLVVAGDVAYNQCHMYVGDTTPESRKNWVAALDRLAAIEPSIVVAGHKKPGSAVSRAIRSKPPLAPSAVTPCPEWRPSARHRNKIGTQIDSGSSDR